MYSRNEQYLEACCNKSGTDELPKPVSRNETLLYRLAEELSKGSDLPTGDTPYQQLVTDSDGNAKWEDKPFYEKTVWKDFVLTSDGAEIEGLHLPNVGETVVVKVNGVDTTETVKYSEEERVKYIGTYDYSAIFSGEDVWCVMSFGGDAGYGLAGTQTTVSLEVTEIRKIEGKFVPLDFDFIRPLRHYLNSGFRLYKILYDSSGNTLHSYVGENINVPDNTSYPFVSFGGSYFEFSGIADIAKDVEGTAFYVFCIRIGVKANGDLSLDRVYYIYGKDENDIDTLATKKGFTLTEKPTV